jgi:hypothetical protein
MLGLMRRNGSGPESRRRGTRGARSALRTLLAAIVRLSPSSRVQPGRRPGSGAGLLRALDRKPGAGRSRPSQGALPIVPVSFLSIQSFAAVGAQVCKHRKAGAAAPR